MTTKQRLRVTIKDKPYTIEVEQWTASLATDTVNGTRSLVPIAAGESGVAPAAAAQPTPAPVPRKPPAPPGPSGSPAGARVEQVHAPMPGIVLNIAVRPGDHVDFGQRLCSLEAMKMNNAIRSPRDGVIATIHVTEGQTVLHHDLLFTFQ